MTTLAEVIQLHRDEIVTLWSESARKAASARGLSESALSDVIASYLSALANELEAGRLLLNDHLHRFVEAHLGTRLRQGFELADIVNEFVLLGSCISRMWVTAPANEWPSRAEIDQLYAQLHHATDDVIRTFTHHMLEDAQAEKRFLRRLQSIASEALRLDAPPLRERLREVLELVMEATESQSAAFLIYNLHEHQLVMVASAGVEELERYATSLDPGSFAGQVAAHAEPTSLLDASTTTLEVPATLRRSGIHSVLGVRLPARHDLIGIMYVGISDTREFTEREARRIESLAERIVLHLDNAHLFAQLNDSVEALKVERSLRERFVEVLAHDLRGPLSVSKMGAELLMQHPESLDQRRDLAIKIDRNIDRTDRMIRDLLDASRITAGEELPLRLDTCDLGELARQIADELRTIHGDRFVVECDDDVRGIWSADELYRALWNLAANAVKYGAPKQPVTITVSHADDTVRASVHNFGAPIPADEQQHLFEPYARFGSAQTVGWGLGLTLVRGCAEAHGGRALVTSDVATGTTFSIELPVDARPYQHRMPEPPGPAPEQSRATMH